MKASDETRQHEAREQEHLDTMSRCRKSSRRRSNPQPLRDDRKDIGAWRPGAR